MSPAEGAKVATGRTADVFAWEEGLVVKKFADSVPQEEIEIELRDAALAFDAGLTQLRCHGIVTLDDGATGLVFDRLDGVALTTVAERNLLRIPEVSRTLAREHARLHAVTVPALPDVREVAVGLLDSPPLGALTEPERATLARQALALPAGTAVLHMDFHPLNVFEHGDGHAVIDWQSTMSGVPAADVAMTRLLFSEAELFPGITPVQRMLYQTVRRIMFGYYFAEYRRQTGLSTADVDAWMTVARIVRLGRLDIESERPALVARLQTAAHEAGA